ncbi:hybrid sensor histidine kinase/response regulator [Sphingomonas pseudosanguinis]|uniref:histidine kinase n=1 Tax=Sphingomonas pseudosanguinis TaxID=413712 RepID=A0A7W6A9P1_9SPHN|nr:PAS domain-containing sensor histidine kinase [Sphingomonas pseudosanguinis]MBB3878615.1 two-component system cell cycle sensor histidine kinase/response regulator CckA [Sphingomonas pseudosanguinis]MBN3536132.1 response regulator [Sphingomonas pseudosanguinis]
MATASPPALSPLKSAAIVSTVSGLGAAALLFFAVRDWVVALGFLAAALLAFGVIAAWRLLRPATEQTRRTIDWDFTRVVADASADAIAVTDRAGRLVCANDAYASLFPMMPTPPGVPLDAPSVEALAQAGRAAWRDGLGRADRIAVMGTELSVLVTRAGDEADLLVWRFAIAEEQDLAETVEGLIGGIHGDRLGAAGIMAALIAPDGRVRAANRALCARAMGGEMMSIVGRDFATFLSPGASGHVQFASETGSDKALRILQVPFVEGEGAPMLVILLDEEPHMVPPVGANAGSHVRGLVALMPFGIALVDRDGRFIQMNSAFMRAAGVSGATPPLYPGDLVVREDKAAVADAIRRFAGGATHSADMAVRLKDHPEEPVALTIAGARGLGEAAVLLSLKDNSEESRLKREVAQATKMQAVGQLAGGVAHDFNNILTAIIGHCDLMLMRHSPGDSDYDDIQQIRTNSNRAASLTRQLLAFSRQQTLRPQILQLPDVVSEVSNLLKRLLGERVRLDVSHGRNLGPIRADPGQLEQVVVNLAVNARDAILENEPVGGGILTIQTRAVSMADVRAMGNDILPAADYTALIISDNGTGIPAEILPKIFEPFFTTKELGKGTGLGLSTVYGIIKQSGGYIFADSPAGGGAKFSIYLPVHAAPAVPAAQLPAGKPASRATATPWGSGTILLVEDEDMVRAVAERALSRQGYSVLAAENGEAALEMLDKHGKPDLLISDVVMPTMDGPTMVGLVRKRYPDLAVLFMSGYAEEQLRKSITLPNVGFLPKPFSVQQLAEATQAALAQQPAGG